MPRCQGIQNGWKTSVRFKNRTARRAVSVSGRGVVVLPGLGNCAEDYAPLKLQLEELGLLVEVADVARVDCLRNAAGLTDMNYWRGTLNPRPTVDWYLARVDAATKLLQVCSSKLEFTL